MNNTSIHKTKSTSRRLKDTNSLKVVLEEDADFNLSTEKKNELISKLKLRIATLKASNEKYRLQIAKHKTEIDKLRSAKAKLKPS